MSSEEIFDKVKEIIVEQLGVGAAYSIIGALQYKKIRKIPMDEALKNVE